MDWLVRGQESCYYYRRCYWWCCVGTQASWLPTLSFNPPLFSPILFFFLPSLFSFSFHLLILDKHFLLTSQPSFIYLSHKHFHLKKKVCTVFCKQKSGSKKGNNVYKKNMSLGSSVSLLIIILPGWKSNHQLSTTWTFQDHFLGLQTKSIQFARISNAPTLFLSIYA